MRPITLAFSLLLVLSLSACSWLSPKPALQAPADWQLRQSKLQQLTDWQAKGRIAIQTEQESSSATLIWQQRGQDFDLLLLGPLGQTVASLKQRKAQVELTIPDQPTYYSDDAELLVEQVLGWRLPISAMPYWLRALDDPKTPAATGSFDAEKRLASLDTGPWHLEFRSYQQQQDLWLPEKIQVTHPEVQLKLSLKEWILGIPHD